MHYDLAALICSVLAFIPALVLHEAAHAFAAYKLGDPTAKSRGLLSLNPAKHIDPFGTVILPLCLMAMNMPVFGYAKPVPYNPAYFEDPRKGDMIVGFAGPAANLLQALAGAAIAAMLWFALPIAQLAAASNLVYYAYFLFLPTFVMTNLCLLFFNIIPIPPLDGSKVLFSFIPDESYFKLMRYERYGMILLLVLVSTKILGGPLSTATSWLFDKFSVFAELGFRLVTHFV